MHGLVGSSMPVRAIIGEVLDTRIGDVDTNAGGHRHRLSIDEDVEM